MELQDSYAAEAVIAVVTFFGFVLPLLGILWSFKWADSSLHSAANGMTKAFRRAGKLGYRYGKKGALSTTTGQKAQQFLGHRRNISALKGKEALRETLNKNERLRKLLGGVGGEAYAARFLDAENRKHEAQQIEELSKGMTLPIAKAISNGQSLTDAKKAGKFNDGKNTPLKDEDRAGIDRLVAQGYLDSDGRLPGGNSQSYVAASAALEELYKADDVTPEGVEGLGKLLQGAGDEANAKFTEMNRSLAVKSSSKNVAFSSFNNGEMEQFANKTPEALMASGLQNLNKDALKYSNADLPESRPGKYEIKPGENMYLKKLRDEAFDENGNRNYAKILERTRQTMNHDHVEVVEGLSYAMGFGDINPKTMNRNDANQVAELQAQVGKFNQLRQSLRTGGTATPPPEFAAVLGREAPPSNNNKTPPSPPVQAPGGGTFDQPGGSGTLYIPRS